MILLGCIGFAAYGLMCLWTLFAQGPEAVQKHPEYGLCGAIVLLFCAILAWLRHGENKRIVENAKMDIAAAIKKANDTATLRVNTAETSKKQLQDAWDGMVATLNADRRKLKEQEDGRKQFELEMTKKFNDEMSAAEALNKKILKEQADGFQESQVSNKKIQDDFVERVVADWRSKVAVCESGKQWALDRKVELERKILNERKVLDTVLQALRRENGPGFRNPFALTGAIDELTKVMSRLDQ